MQGDPIPPEHHVLRYAAPSRLDKDDDEQPIGLLHTALQRRSEKDAYLSVQWAEYFSDDLLACCHQAIRAHVASGYSVSRNGAYGLAKVADLHSVAAANRPSLRLRVAHEPEETNPPHAGIHDLPAEDHELLEALAFDAFADLILIRNVPEL